MNYAVVELLQYVPDYMKLVQENEIEIVYQLVGHGMVSPHRFLSDDFISPLALACEKVICKWQSFFGCLGHP